LTVFTWVAQIYDNWKSGVKVKDGAKVTLRANRIHHNVERGITRGGSVTLLEGNQVNLTTLCSCSRFRYSSSASSSAQFFDNHSGSEMFGWVEQMIEYISLDANWKSFRYVLLVLTILYTILKTIWRILIYPLVQNSLF
jgi:hypothetical protein